MSYVRWTVIAILALAGLAPCVASDGSGVVPLRAAVEVKPGVLWLSDLLPDDAPASLQKAGAAIEICRTPQPGSVRILEAQQIGRRLRQQPDIFRQLIVPPRISVRAAGWPMREETVRGAIAKLLREQGGGNELPDGAKLQWAETFAATVDHPLLEATGLAWDERQQDLQVRLRCLSRRSCGSFLVRVILTSAISQQWHDNLSAGPGTGAGQPQSASGALGQALAEPGKPATLVLDNRSMRISLRVICLQRGSLHQQIRVFDARSRRVFRAEVVGAGRLHATL